MPSATAPTSSTASHGDSACMRSSRASDGTERASDRTKRTARTRAAAAPSTGACVVQADGQRRGRPQHALAHVEALGERSVAAAERRARLDAADDGPEPVGRLDVVQRERERAAQRARRDRADEHEVARRRVVRAPADERVADLPDLDRAADAAAPPDDVPVGDQVLELRAPPERDAPGAEREGRAPGGEEDHARRRGRRATWRPRPRSRA